MSLQADFPGKEVTPPIFYSVGPGDNIEERNAYSNRCAQEHKLPSLIFAVPQWSALELEEKILAGQKLNGYNFGYVCMESQTITITSGGNYNGYNII